MCFLINFPYHGKKQQNRSNRERLRNWFPYNFHSIGAFSIRFKSCGTLHHMENVWVFSLISHNIGKCSKNHPAIQIPILFSKEGYFSSIKFPPYGILHHVRNAWVFPSIFHSMGKFIEDLELWPILLLSYRSFCFFKFPVYGWYMDFPTNFLCYG